MPGQPAYQKEVRVSSQSTGTFRIVPLNTASLDDSNDVLDDTDLTSSGERSRVLGLRDWTVSGTANWDPDSSGLDLIRNSKLGRDQIYVQYLPDGQSSNGFQGPAKVENYNFSGGVEDLESIDVSMPSDGALGSA